MNTGPVDFKKELQAGRERWNKRDYTLAGRHYFAALCEIERQIKVNLLGFPPQRADIKKLYYQTWISWSRCAAQSPQTDENQAILDVFTNQIDVFKQSLKSALQLDELYMLCSIHAAMLLIRHKRLDRAEETLLELYQYLPSIEVCSSDSDNFTFLKYKLECISHLAELFSCQGKTAQAIAMLTCVNDPKFESTNAFSYDKEIQQLLILLRANLLECYLNKEESSASAAICFSELKNLIDSSHIVPLNARSLLSMIRYAKFACETNSRRYAIEVFNYVLSHLTTSTIQFETPEFVSQCCMLGASLYLHAEDGVNPNLALTFIRLAEKYAVNIPDKDRPMFKMQCLLMKLIVWHYLQDEQAAKDTLLKLVELYKELTPDENLPAYQLLTRLLPFFPQPSTSFFTNQVKMLKLELENMERLSNVFFSEELDKAINVLASLYTSPQIEQVIVINEPKEGLLLAKKLHDAQPQSAETSHPINESPVKKNKDDEYSATSQAGRYG